MGPTSIGRLSMSGVNGTPVAFAARAKPLGTAGWSLSFHATTNAAS
jgi:hypothetical protein